MGPWEFDHDQNVSGDMTHSVIHRAGRGGWLRRPPPHSWSIQQLSTSLLPVTLPCTRLSVTSVSHPHRDPTRDLGPPCVHHLSGGARGLHRLRGVLLVAPSAPCVISTIRPSNLLSIRRCWVGGRGSAGFTTATGRPASDDLFLSIKFFLLFLTNPPGIFIMFCSFFPFFLFTVIIFPHAI